MPFYSLVFNVDQTFRTEERKKMEKEERKKKERETERKIKRKERNNCFEHHLCLLSSISGRVSSISFSIEIDFDTCILPVFYGPGLRRIQSLMFCLSGH